MKFVQTFLAAALIAGVSAFSTASFAGDVGGPPYTAVSKAAQHRTADTLQPQVQPEVRRPQLAVGRPHGWKTVHAKSAPRGSLLLRNGKLDGSIAVLPIRLAENETIEQDLVTAFVDTMSAGDITVEAVVDRITPREAAIKFDATIDGKPTKGRLTVLRLGPESDLLLIVLGTWSPKANKQAERDFRQFLDSVTLTRSKLNALRRRQSAHLQPQLAREGAFLYTAAAGLIS